jgi:CBS domain-containing protein
MLRLRDIMTTDLVTVTPETTIREAMEQLAMHHLSGAPVISGGSLVGVVTTTDLMSFAAALPGVPVERDERDEWGEGAEPTVDEQARSEADPSGAYFTALWDDAGADVVTRFDSVAGPEWNSLEEHDVSEVMTTMPLHTLGPDASADAAAEVMRAHGVHRVLVTDGTTLLGIVSALDIARAAAKRQFSSKTYVFNHDQDFRAR